MTAYTKFKEYIWLVNTIYQAKSITFAEINERWLKTEMSEEVEMARTTFYRHKCAIEEIFGIYIECDKKNGNKYYIGNEYVLAPYCVKLFHQRCYLLAMNQKEQMSVFALDRILELKMMDEKFKVGEDFDANDFFADCYGVVVNSSKLIERIALRAYGREALAVLNLPIHHSQRVVKRADDYTEIEVCLRPTDDFVAHVLSKGPWLQVISPPWLVDEVKGWLNDTLDRYKTQKNVIKLKIAVAIPRIETMQH